MKMRIKYNYIYRIIIKYKIYFIIIIFLIFIIFNNTIKYNNYINVAYAFDKKYHYITHCSMKSIMLSQNKDTFINFYVLIPSYINEAHKSIINKICLQHHNCKIQFIYMENNFTNLNPKFWSTAVFYRLKLQDLLINEKKILYLDSDTIIYKDLSKIYNYDINGKYYIGMLEPQDPKLNIKIDNFINTGVLLMNLYELRKDGISKKIIEFLYKNIDIIDFPINDSINLICSKKNGFFSPEYVQWGFCNIDFIDIYINKLTIKLNKKIVRKYYKDPYIYHLIGNWKKPWNGIPYYNKKVCTDPFTRFYEIARKTDYYYEILNEFKF